MIDLTLEPAARTRRTLLTPHIMTCEVLRIAMDLGLRGKAQGGFDPRSIDLHIDTFSRTVLGPILGRLKGIATKGLPTSGQWEWADMVEQDGVTAVVYGGQDQLFINVYGKLIPQVWSTPQDDEAFWGAMGRRH